MIALLILGAILKFGAFALLIWAGIRMSEIVERLLLNQAFWPAPALVTMIAISVAAVLVFIKVMTGFTQMGVF